MTPQLGLPAPPQPGFTPALAGQPTAPPGPVNIGGVVTMQGVASIMEQARQLEAQFAEQQARPVITGLAGHIKAFWVEAEQAKRSYELQMLEALYARRGEYTAERLAAIVKDNQPPIYMMLASAKMRQVEALLRDVLIGAGTDKPWSLMPTPKPDLPPSVVMQAVQALQQEIQQAMMLGVDVTLEMARQRMREMKDMLDARMREEARVMCERMELKMEDQLVEGEYLDALDQFIADIATFKTAFIAGPIVRRRPKLEWGDDGQMVVKDELSLGWERVDPFDMYFAPYARHVNDGPCVRRHRLSRQGLFEMIGVPGYSDASIREVIKQYGESGLKNWLAIDSERSFAEGKEDIYTSGTAGLIDALQYWGSASGQMLIDWGIEDGAVTDPQKEYQIEAWMIGPHVIKAVLNADPLARRPYYGSSFQRVPGSVWGNSPYDLMVDCQDMCNAAARSLAANLGIASGPQVAVLSDRMPPGEDITSMYPWKIWQFTADPMGSTATPIQFFQPNSNAQELMGVYEKFSSLADEYTGIPRYTTGLESSGAGRTASGLSMMLGNASKVIKQVVGSIDFNVIKPMLERLYYYNMRYSDDPDLKGDVGVVARGAMSMMTKEAAQARTTEFLAATANPIDMQIIGLEGRAELLRNASKRLDLNADKVVPPISVLRQRAAAQAMQQAQQMQAQQAQEGSQNGQELMNGAPVSDHFSPQPA